MTQSASLESESPLSGPAKAFRQPLEWQEAIGFLMPLFESARLYVLVATADHWGILQDVLYSLTYPVGNLFFDGRMATDEGYKH